MGALHAGHASLIRASAGECDRTVVSIYVNPTQFGPGEDFDEYPRRLDDDCAAADSAGADLVFCPSDRSMYPDGSCTTVRPGGPAEVLEGRLRPGHFEGVCTIVCKLFNTVPAGRAYFGRKDFQQTVVIRRMVADLNIPIEVRVMPTIREPDGLALSSRNAYLSDVERQQATCLYHALAEARRLVGSGETNADTLREAMRAVISREPLAQIEYAEVVDGSTMRALEVAGAGAVAVLAVRVGDTRLIDNVPLNPNDYVS